MHLKALLMVYKINKFSDILFVNLLFPEPRDFAKFYRTLHSHPSFQNGEALKQLYVLKTNGLKASRSTDSFLLHWTTNICFQWKILKTVEPFFLYIISLENNIPTIGLFWRWRATTALRPRDTHVANDDLSVSSQNSIEIHSRDIVFCRLETDNCAHFLLGRRLNSSCWPVFVLFWNFLICFV